MRLNVRGALEYARQRLQAKLPNHLIYHNVGHTFDDVLPAVRRLGRLCNVSRLDMDLLTVAAAFHDMGFIDRAVDHETLSITIMREILPDYGFYPVHLKKIAGMIEATRLPQSPHTLLEAILADADLDVLGRDDFWALNSALRAEQAALGRTFTDVEWYEGQLAFLRQHHYFTEAARQLREAPKQRHIEEMEARLAALRVG